MEEDLRELLSGVSLREVVMSVRQAIVAEASRIEEDSLYSSKGHFQASRIWAGLHLWIGIPTAIMAAATSVLAFSSITVIAGIGAVIVAALTAVSTFLNPSERAQRHYIAGTKFNGAKE